MFRKIVTAQIHFLSINILWTLSSLCLLPIYLTAFSPEDYGRIAIFMVLIAFGNYISTGNLQSGYTAYYFSVSATDRINYLHNIIRWAASTGSVFLVVGGLLILTCNLFLEAVFTPFLLCIALTIALLKSLQGIYNVYLQHEKKNQFFSVTNGIVVGFNFILQCIFILVLDWGVKAVLYALLISHLLGVGVCYYSLRTASVSKKNLPIKNVVRYSIGLIPFLFSEWLVIRGDRLVVEQYFDLAETGVYALTMNVAFLLSAVGTSYFNAIRPEFFSFLQKSTSFKQLYSSYFFIGFLLMMGVGMIGIYCLSFALTYFASHPKYLQLQNYLWLALLLIFIRITKRFFYEVFVFQKNHIYQNTLSIITALLFMLTLYFYYPYITLMEIFYASILANTMSLLFTVYKVHQSPTYV